MKYTMSVLVENHAGVLSKVSGLFSRRGFNIDSLAVGVTEDPTISRMTIVVNGDEYTVEQLEKQLNKVIPVINMRTRFNLPPVERDSRTRIVVMEFDQKIVGFLVDGVSEVLRIPASTVEAAPPVVCGVGSEYIRGVGKLDDRLLILLDLDTLLSDTKAEVG